MYRRICALKGEQHKVTGGNVGIFSKLFGKSTQIGNDIADDIVQASFLGGHTLVHNWVGDKSAGALATALATNECLYFFLHYINRLAFSAGGQAAQRKIHDPITCQAFAKLAAQTPSSISDAYSMLQEGANAAELSYGKCRVGVAPKDNDSLAGTLFWEASKRICAAVGNGESIANIVGAGEILATTLSTLKLEKRIPVLV